MKKRISTAIFGAALFAVMAQAQLQPLPQPRPQSPQPPQPPQPPTQTTSTRVSVGWSDPSRPGLVKVSLMFGSITVRTHTANNVIVESAEGSRQGRRGRAPDPNAEGLTLIGGRNLGLSVQESNNVMTISSSMFGQGANLDILVPVKTNLELGSINGNAIVVEGVDGEIDITNNNGDVRLVNVSGSVIANSRNGNVSAIVREVTPNKAMSFASFNGNVDVTLPASAKANLRVRTDNGDFWSGFDNIQLGPSGPPVQTRNSRGIVRIEPDRTTNGTINGGGPAIDLRAFNGNIYLRKAP